MTEGSEVRAQRLAELDIERTDDEIALRPRIRIPDLGIHPVLVHGLFVGLFVTRFLVEESVAAFGVAPSILGLLIMLGVIGTEVIKAILLVEPRHFLRRELRIKGISSDSYRAESRPHLEIDGREVGEVTAVFVHIKQTQYQTRTNPGSSSARYATRSSITYVPLIVTKNALISLRASSAFEVHKLADMMSTALKVRSVTTCQRSGGGGLWMIPAVLMTLTLMSEPHWVSQRFSMAVSAREIQMAFIGAAILTYAALVLLLQQRREQRSRTLHTNAIKAATYEVSEELLAQIPPESTYAIDLTTGREGMMIQRRTK